ncbi:MAG: hypothetical protein HC927_03105, partial [Deltaproteobacteria bacterium]|nr:hypothetical protein [Deltaproteobacteria bacterium]
MQVLRGAARVHQDQRRAHDLALGWIDVLARVGEQAGDPLDRLVGVAGPKLLLRDPKAQLELGLLGERGRADVQQLLDQLRLTGSGGGEQQVGPQLAELGLGLDLRGG